MRMCAGFTGAAIHSMRANAIWYAKAVIHPMCAQMGCAVTNAVRVPEKCGSGRRQGRFRGAISVEHDVRVELRRGLPDDAALREKA